MGIRAIVVEDELSMRRMICSRLAGIGIEIVAEIDNAKAALEQFRALQRDLITLDIHLAESSSDDVDALALVAKLRKENPYTKCPELEVGRKSDRALAGAVKPVPVSCVGVRGGFYFSLNF